jgi:enamine deaminase RidA (YjgF/YER057c/UK114 family)
VAWAAAKISGRNPVKEKIPTPRGMNDPIGNYSYGFKVTGRTTLYLSGLAGLGADGKVMGHGDMGAQSARAFDRLEAILAEAGATLKNVVKTTTYVTTFEGLDGHKAEVRKRFGDGDYPAGTLVMVKALAREGMLIEIEALAVLDD